MTARKFLWIQYFNLACISLTVIILACTVMMTRATTCLTRATTHLIETGEPVSPRDFGFGCALADDFARLPWIGLADE